MIPTDGTLSPQETQRLDNSPYPWLDAIPPDDLSAAMEAVYCRQELNRIADQTSPCCAERALIAELPPPGSKHYRKAVCGSCGHYHGWIKKPQNITARATSTTGLKPGLYCVLCLATDALEVHHIIEIAEGGTNAQDNRMTLCQACHALVHWLRRYRRTAP